ncbi:flavin prenyltransferase UbiX [Gayadomonas joobiniege]|uniref:flavin prenyltransferase UbiX n=1 Tax=Gayadomonas joobiniege TaxID=1234606 RepID=UPI000363E65A|nr:flavin prenyltransferase UbiX [Gayadomonas joobiniege]
MPQTNKQITLALTGASGMPYALTLIKSLLKAGVCIHLLVSSAARVVLKTESQLDVPAAPDKAQKFWQDYCGVEGGQILCYGKEEWFSPVASGSAAPKTMLVCPCSMSTVSAISQGSSNTLIERAADVVIKERGQLIIVPREMPFSVIHLENMTRLAKLGATIMPACPGFYHQPETIQDLTDFVVARILDHMAIEQRLLTPWGYKHK